MIRDVQHARQAELTARKVKRLLVPRGDLGGEGIAQFSSALGLSNAMDNIAVTTGQLTAALDSCSITLEPYELESIFAMLDRSDSGAIDAAEFMALMCDDFTPLRRAYLQRVWGTRASNKMTRQRFLQHYAAVSASVGDDASFVDLLRGELPPSNAPVESSGTSHTQKEPQEQHYYHTDQSLEEKTSVARQAELQAAIRHVIRTEHTPYSMSGGVATRGLYLSFATIDTEHNGFVSAGDFAAALRQHRLYLRDPALVAGLDTNGDGSVDLYYYMALLLPPLPAVRCLMVERLLELLFPETDGSGTVSVQDFQKGYRASSAIDKDDFLSAWDVRKAVGGRVTLDEVLLWYVPQSALQQRDADFKALLHRQWGNYDHSQDEEEEAEEGGEGASGEKDKDKRNNGKGTEKEKK